MNFSTGNHWSLRGLLVGTVAAIGLAAIVASGGGGGGEAPNTGPTGVNAYNFTAANMLPAASLAAASMSFFPEFTDVAYELFNLLESGGLQANVPADGTATVCTNDGNAGVAATLTWTDADSSATLSSGDTAVLAVTNCDLDGSGATASGSVNLVFNSVNISTPPVQDISVSTAINLAVTDPTIGTNTLAAGFGATIHTANGLDYTYHYTAADQSGQTLSVVQNNVTLYQFGCFDVTHKFTNSPTSGTYALAPAGVVNAANKIMSLAGGGDLQFLNNALESGTKRLLSLAVPDCAAVGAPSGVPDSDGSYIDIVGLGLGDGSLRLDLYDASDTLIPPPVYTTWSAIY